MARVKRAWNGGSPEAALVAAQLRTEEAIRRRLPSMLGVPRRGRDRGCQPRLGVVPDLPRRGVSCAAGGNADKETEHMTDTTPVCPHCGKPILSRKAATLLRYFRRECPRRGFLFEGARPVFESGEYHDVEITELLRAGAIEPHPDPAKGWRPKW